jgi:hypothetical protein
MLVPQADIESEFTFYYDETNNLRKFYVKENDFNYSFTANFVLGGLVHEGNAPEVSSLIAKFKLQKNVKEVKFKHIAKGEFIDCLKSQKINLLLQFLKDNEIYVHYSSLNILYWSIVDIVDSAIMSSDAAMKLGMPFATHLKNDLYKLSKLEIESVINLFYKFEYPNIKGDKITDFIEQLISLFGGYIDDPEYHFGLESLRQILKQSKKKNELPFVTDDEDYILLKDLSIFYLRPIYVFKNSNHVFDNEDSISEILADYRITDEGIEFKNYSFVDSQSNQLVQLSDVFIGLIGKFSRYRNTNSEEKIKNDFDSFNDIQRDNINLLFDIIEKSNQKNIAFFHSTDSYEEMKKVDYINQIRKQNL